MEFMVDVVGTLRLPEKGNDVVVRVVYYWSSCTVRGFTLGWRGNSVKMDFAMGPGKVESNVKWGCDSEQTRTKNVFGLEDHRSGFNQRAKKIIKPSMESKITMKKSPDIC